MHTWAEVTGQWSLQIGSNCRKGGKQEKLEAALEPQQEPDGPECEMAGTGRTAAGGDEAQEVSKASRLPTLRGTGGGKVRDWEPVKARERVSTQ